ncbi:MAG: hypothetical protein R3C18_12160 [Planctomycetaceae bacterium]
MDNVLALVASTFFANVNNGALTTQVCIGDNTLVQKRPTPGQGAIVNIFQCVIVDLRDLSVQENFAWNSSRNVPPQFGKYVGKGEYLLIMTTCEALRESFVPEGELFALLQKVGAMDKLQRLADALTHMDDRPMPPPGKDLLKRGYCYILVATMGFGDDRGLEAVSLSSDILLDFKLVWSDVLKRYVPAGYQSGFQTAVE